jgi:IMP dehydrogenase
MLGSLWLAWKNRQARKFSTKAAVQIVPRHGSKGAMQGYGKDRYGTNQGAPENWCPKAWRVWSPTKAGWQIMCISWSAGCAQDGLCRGRESDGSARTHRLFRITNAGLIESHPHDITITRENPNYQRSE